MREFAEKLAKQRADEKVAKKLRADLAQQRRKEGLTAINEHLIAAGNSERYATTMTDLISKDGNVLKAFPETEVDTDVLESYRIRTLRIIFASKFHGQFPFRMSDLQKQEIIDKILDSHTCMELADLQPDISKQCYKDALRRAIHERTSSFVCPVCMDPMVSVTDAGYVDTSNMWFAPLRKTEHWSNHSCGHACCRSCMATWAEIAINDQKLRIKCPALGCSYSLWDQDLRELVSDEAFAHHQEHKSADYLKHLKKTIKKDVSLKLWLHKHARPCPDCHVIVSRSEGCNHMTCVCGTRFCYACGFKRCRCYSANKTDIWNPQP
jgi:hypothetical protein